MRVRAEKDCHSSVEIMGECLLFGGRFRMEVKDGNIIFSLVALQYPVGADKRIFKRLHHDNSKYVDNKNRHSRSFRQNSPVSRNTSRKICRPQDIFVFLKQIFCIIAAKRMVPCCNDVGARRKQCMRRRFIDSVSLGAVFSVDNGKIDFVFLSVSP